MPKRILEKIKENKEKIINELGEKFYNDILDGNVGRDKLDIIFEVINKTDK